MTMGEYNLCFRIESKIPVEPISLTEKLDCVKNVIEKRSEPNNFDYDDELKMFLPFLKQTISKGKQIGQAKGIRHLQQVLLERFESEGGKKAWNHWGKERLVSGQSNRGDKADLCTCQDESFDSKVDDVIIELDKHRADQVAKKFLARVALKSGQNLIYVALCYPGTVRMSIPECLKYFEYCSLVADSLSLNASQSVKFIGYLITNLDAENNFEKVETALKAIELRDTCEIQRFYKV